MFSPRIISELNIIIAMMPKDIIVRGFDKGVSKGYIEDVRLKITPFPFK